jgi:hypothetical protein
MDQNKRAKVIAFYLPQFHTIPENDKWWGEGFTEWVNVKNAKKLYKSHEQPKIPTDLGYYDLRQPEVREQQAILAKEAGIDAFCYWHYWFGNGKQLLEMPLNEVIKTGKPDFPFCLAWANHSWENKTWSSIYEGNLSKLLVEQVYPGVADYDLHFYKMLNAFKDKRYYRINDKLVFVIYRPLELPDCNAFIERWQQLAEENKIQPFYFIAHTYDESLVSQIKRFKFDAINLSLHHRPFDNKMTFFHKLKRYIRSNYLKKPERVLYSKAITSMKDPIFRETNIFPTLIPNWDHTPRSGVYGRVFDKSTPQLFGKHIDDILKLIENKPEINKVIFIKSWNEWGEGNYLEPDSRYGNEYLKVLKSKIFY